MLGKKSAYTIEPHLMTEEIRARRNSEKLVIATVIVIKVYDVVVLELLLHYLLAYLLGWVFNNFVQHVRILHDPVSAGRRGSGSGGGFR